jgi:nucleoid DNA-binding protein
MVEADFSPEEATEAVVEAKAEVHSTVEAVVDEATEATEATEAIKMVAYAKLEKRAKTAKYHHHHHHHKMFRLALTSNRVLHTTQTPLVRV